MTVVYAADPGPDGPRTHALVIGVGHYPHLPGGGGPLADQHEGLGQLTSPPASARDVAAWLIEHFDNADRPLGSVRLLLSEPRDATFVDPKTGAATAVNQAKAGTIAGAISDWCAAGHTHADNLMLFFFCGHGLAEGVDTALLAADFGAEAHNPLNGAIDLRKLQLGLKARCKARQACFFIDVCRSPATLTDYAESFAGRVPLLPGQFAGRREAPIFYSAQLGKRAFGPPGARSHFTRALLDGLSGAGARYAEGAWKVGTTMLATAIHALMKLQQEQGKASIQLPTNEDLTVFHIHTLPDEPLGRVAVSCRPESATPEATLICRSGAEEFGRRQPTPAEQVWQLEIPLDRYDFEAVIESGVPRRGRERRVYIIPPLTEVSIEVRP